MSAFAQLGFYISKWRTIKIMAITNKLFICLKEMFPEAAGNTFRSKTDSLCLWKWKMEVWLTYTTATSLPSYQSSPSRGAQSMRASPCLLGLCLLVVLEMKSPWSSGSKAIPERSRKGCKTEATLHTKLPPSNNPHLIDTAKSYCFFHWIRNILPGQCGNWSHCKGGKL